MCTQLGARAWAIPELQVTLQTILVTVSAGVQGSQEHHNRLLCVAESVFCSRVALAVMRECAALKACETARKNHIRSVGG